jgi:hypothetical protein
LPTASRRSSMFAFRSSITFNAAFGSMTTS